MSPRPIVSPNVDLRTSLDDLHTYTNHPYRCPQQHRTHLDPYHSVIPPCPQCGMALKEDAPLATSQFALDRDRTFLHRYTPEEAILIIDSIPDDSFHWPAIEWNRVEYYADYILKGKWHSFGQHWHPMRFNGEGVLLTGAQRILAVFLADRPMDAWTVDHSESWFRNGTFVGPPPSFPMNSDHHRDED